MTYIDDYRARLNHFGENNREKTIEATKQSVNHAFDNNPSFQQVTIDGELIDAIVNKGTKSYLKKVLFRPNSSYENGTIFQINNKQYMMIDFQDNDVYPYADSQLCNNTLKVDLPPIHTITGYDEMYNPIYSDVPDPNSPFTTPCIVNELADLNQSMVSQSVSYTNTDVSLTIQNKAGVDTLLLDKTFNMFGNSYHIYGFQRHKTLDNDKGLLIILAHNIAQAGDGS